MKKHNRNKISTPAVKLYRAWSIFPWLKSTKNVRVNWYCEDRIKPVVKYHEVIKNYHKLPVSKNTHMYMHYTQSRMKEYVDQFFIKKEIEEIREYLKQEYGLSLEYDIIDIPIADKHYWPYKYCPMGGMCDSIYYDDENYRKLSIKLFGYFDAED